MINHGNLHPASGRKIGGTLVPPFRVHNRVCKVYNVTNCGEIEHTQPEATSAYNARYTHIATTQTWSLLHKYILPLVAHKTPVSWLSLFVIISKCLKPKQIVRTTVPFY